MDRAHLWDPVRKAIVLVGLVASGCSPSPATAGTTTGSSSPCADGEAFLAAVSGHATAQLVAAQRACNAGCVHGCAIAAESALLGRTGESDLALAAALGRMGCDRGDARACFVRAVAEETRAEEAREPAAREAARASYARGCELGDARACAWGAVSEHEHPPAALLSRVSCRDPFVGRWIAARRAPTTEIELHVSSHEPSGALAGRIEKRVWSGGRGARIAPHCQDYGARGTESPARPLVARATLVLAGSSDGKRVALVETETRQHTLECGAAPAALTVMGALGGDLVGPNELRLREAGSDDGGALVFVRVACESG